MINIADLHQTAPPDDLGLHCLLKKKIPCREKSGNLKFGRNSGNFKKSYLCKVKIFKFCSCSDVATGGFFLPYA